MSDPKANPHPAAILRLFLQRAEGRFSAADLKGKLARSPKGQAPRTADQTRDALNELIAAGYVRVTGGGKDGDHPRPKASYRITDEGRNHLRPTKPTHLSEPILQAQRAYLLLHLARNKRQRLSRSEINTKAKTRFAIGSLELDPEVIDYHLAKLEEEGAIQSQRSGTSISYQFEPEAGLTALASSTQYDSPDLTFTLSASLLNALLAAARNGQASRSEPNPDAESDETTLADRETDLADEPRVYAEERVMTRDDILQSLAELRRGMFQGKDLVPIHALRRRVGEHLGADAASHARFDPLLMEMRSEGSVELIAISDHRLATADQLQDSIPGINETLFYLVVE